jgi:hypothetical protein
MVMVALLVGDQASEEVTRAEIALVEGRLSGLGVIAARLHLVAQVGFENTAKRIAAADTVELADVGRAFEEHEPVEQPVGMALLLLHLVAHLARKPVEPPVLQDVRVQQVLDLGGRARRVDADDNRTDALGADIGEEPFGPVLGVHGDLVVGDLREGFEPAGAFVDYPAFRRSALLANNVITGPALIGEEGTCTVIHTGDRATVDGMGCLLIEAGLDA